MAVTAPVAPAEEPTMTSGEVARMFGVKPRAVRRWDGKLTVLRTPGGHRRYRASEVQALYSALLIQAVA